MYYAVYMIAIKRYVDHDDLTRFIKPKMLLITNHYKHPGGVHSAVKGQRIIFPIPISHSHSCRLAI